MKRRSDERPGHEALEIGLLLLRRDSTREEAAARLLRGWERLLAPGAGPPEDLGDLVLHRPLRLNASERAVVARALTDLSRGDVLVRRRLMRLAYLLDRAAREKARVGRGLAGVIVGLTVLAIVVGAALAPSRGVRTGWLREVYAGLAPTGRVAAVGRDDVLDADFGLRSPAEGVGRDRFSVRWTSCLHVRDGEAGRYQIRVESGDELRLLLDGGIVLQRSETGETNTVTRQVGLSRGIHRLRLVLVDHFGKASVRFDLARALQPPRSLAPTRFTLPLDDGACGGGPS